MELRDVVRRTFFKPVWLAGPPKVEQWTCPACGAVVDRVSPAWKGVWFTAGPDEVTALCARTHRTHDRRGAPLPVDDPPVGEDWIPVVALDERGVGPPASFIALVPPHGVAFVLDAAGDRYELRRLADLKPSDLVGRRAPSLAGTVIGRLGVDGVCFDELRGAVRVVAELGLTVGDASAGDALQGGEGPTAV